MPNCFFPVVIQLIMKKYIYIDLLFDEKKIIYIEINLSVTSDIKGKSLEIGISRKIYSEKLPFRQRQKF